MSSWSDASYTWYSTASDYSEVLTDDSRKCQVEGCHRKHAFVRLAGGRKVYSKYCAEHTCAKTYPEDEGYHCPTPRKAGERYCDDHLRCGEPGCDRRGEYIGVREYIPWFCVQHRCTAPDCHSRATDSRQQRCGRHVRLCGVPGCARPAHQHRDGRLDLVCAVHYGIYRCVWPDCSRSTGSSMRYCPAHKCCVAECAAGRDATGGTDACAKHRCTVPRCPNPVLYPSHPRSLHCTLHTCRAAGCVSPRTSTTTSTSSSSTTTKTTTASDFCPTHTCLTPHCTAPARFAHSHCTRHACAVANCANARLGAADPAGALSPSSWRYRDRCEAHARARERRAVSVGGLEDIGIGIGTTTGTGAGVAGVAGGGGGGGGDGGASLRDRFELELAGERERKRLSDDLEALRRREREREREAERRRAEVERLRRDLEEWRGLNPDRDRW
ncbi:uncharacterized protein THITE_163041 [Thermothielavioides terrestris NRRL 8126]|uniref:Uncharacterized protein n=1 Tax=Thermothielavioides terrestris (strain ATCC 38088 / NRRL 8126) TaxID=578455 RepID=G2R9C5_THETT|nr:uncharacterized protein THITE_163041 [Thermothielavioides terrestris NRRL 8126]AEO68666.1 hypothetical protein THITE_163041 [Thermothielavioides terrestris NRRL 8126]